MQHHGYHSSIPNNYQQYYPHTNWNPQQVSSGHTRVGSHAATNSMENPYPGNNQGINVPNSHVGQWHHTSSNFGPAHETWNNPNWNYREWQPRDNVSFASEYPSQVGQNQPFHLGNSTDPSHRPNDPEMVQRGNGTNYLRTLQYVQQCQATWDSELDKNSHAN